MLEGRGQIIESEEIRFDQVPLISPNGDVLVKSMSFNVEPGVSGAAWHHDTVAHLSETPACRWPERM